MKTVEELREELKSTLQNCTHANDGSLAAHVDENIRWAWNNWDIDFSEYYSGSKKPENYTPEFRDEWIDNEPFDAELEYINAK